MQLRGTHINASACEIFGMWATRLIITADDERWRDTAVQSATGYGTSFIGCDVEAGLEQNLDPSQTPDGRPGAAMLFCQRRTGALKKAVQNRTGQCLMTCPTTAVFDGMSEQTRQRYHLGKWVRFFGDGHQYEQTRHARAGWVVPVMAGEFFCEADAGYVKGAGGAALFVCGRDARATLSGAERAVHAIASMPGIITPFPGGICRAGSKVGARHHKLIASTNDAYCPTLRDHANTETRLRDDVQCVYEIIINGVSEDAVARALGTGAEAAAGEGVIELTTGVHGGKLTGTRLQFDELLRAAANVQP